jgi:DNA-binding transcriptional LysR family regulator
MELRHLRYLVAIAEEKSVTRAAARLGMQQPPLSQQLRCLEEEIGFRLFDRRPRGMQITAAGATFLEDALGLLAGVERAKERAARVAAGSAGTLSIGFTSSAATHRIAPEIIAAFRRSYPGIHLNFDDGNAATLTQAVLLSSLDIAFVRAPVAQSPDLVCDKLQDEPMLIALASSHPLARQKACPPAGLHLRVLADEPFILVRRPGAPGMYANLVAACQDAGFTPHIAHEVGSMLTNLVLVAAGVGVSIVPASMRGTHARRVTFLPLRRAHHLHAPITLLSRRQDDNPAVASFLAVARAVAHRGR